MRFLFIPILFCFINGITQQAPIAMVSTNGSTRLVSTLDEAIVKAQDGDIIYLPAGSIPGASSYFTKRVSVIGVGHHPDSASATGRTEIVGSIFFSSEGSSFDGAYVTEAVGLSANSRFVRINADYFAAFDATVEGTVIQNCISRGETGTGLAGLNQLGVLSRTRIINTIIAGAFTNAVYDCAFENCIFLIQGSYPYADLGLRNTFTNCVFPYLTAWPGGQMDAIFRRNLFGINALPELFNPGNSSGNIFDQLPETIFENVPTNSYAYTYNFRLKNGSSGKNAGTDGKDLGIYGGQTPYVDAAIPPNPSIRSRVIADETTINGNLRVRFNVRVQ